MFCWITSERKSIKKKVKVTLLLILKLDEKVLSLLTDVLLWKGNILQRPSCIINGY